METPKVMRVNVDLIFLDKKIEEVFIDIKNQMNERIAELEKLMSAESPDQKRMDELKSDGFDLLSVLTEVLIDGLNEGTIDLVDDDDYDDQVIGSA